ncbi:MAG TPA: protein translocase subunit SecF [Bryobacteraceae bacterium]|jgi:preprotein translocase subunit SecF
MELFRNTNYDFLGKKWPFIIASLILTAAGFISLAIKGGPRYGIEFKGGMLITVRFLGTPPLDEIRSALDKALPSAPTVQSFEAATNEVSIGTEGADDVTLSKNHQIVLDTLKARFGNKGGGKLDLNNSSPDALADRLRTPLQTSGAGLSDDQLKALAKAITTYRDTPPQSGLIANLDDLSKVPGVTPQILNVVKQECFLAPYSALRGTEVVGPKVGADLRRQAIYATLLALAGMLAYIWFRFEWMYGLGAVIAVFHDTLITIGMFSLFNKEMDLTVIAALLTLVGYSMNDTIVIFDRIRENLKMNLRMPLEAVMNLSVNQTLSRTVMTSGLTFLTCIALFLFGGPVLHGFSFALVCGIIVGTYSSVFIASPIVLYFGDYADRHRKPAAVVSASNAARAKSPAKAAK